MRRRLVLPGLTAFFFAASPPPSGAQVGYLWSYGELLQKADLVVIGECQGTSDTGRHRPHPELRPASLVRELRTTFRVSAVVKGGTAVPIGSEMAVRHYRWEEEVLKRGLVNGGFWLRLETHRSYLLFLRRAADGVYEPLSGHTFPNDSVFLLDRMSASMFNEDGSWSCPPLRVKQ
jgi:hypothetical protein